MDLLSIVNGSLNSVAVALIVSGAMEVQKGNFQSGVILLVAGFVARILYESMPDKPTV